MIFSACELGVFDLLLRSPEPMSAQHVARELSTSVDGTERLLDALVGMEILEVETSDGAGEEEEEEEALRNPTTSRKTLTSLSCETRKKSVKSADVENVDSLNLSSFATAVYSSTDVANLYLARGSSKSLHDMIAYQSQTVYPLWNHLADAVR